MNTSDSPKQQTYISELHHSDDSERMGKDELASMEQDFWAMERAIRSWAVAIIVLNIVHLLIPVDYQIYHAYWLVLILLGMTTFYFRSTLMMVVISTYVITEGVTQVLLGAEFGLFFLLAIIYVIGSMFLYNRYNKTEKSYREASNVRVSGLLTWQDLGRRFSFIAPTIGIIGFCSSLTIVILTSLLGINHWLPATTFYLTLFEISGLSLGFGIAAFAAMTPRRWLAMVGIIIGLLIWFWEMVSAV